MYIHSSTVSFTKYPAIKLLTPADNQTIFIPTTNANHACGQIALPSQATHQKAFTLLWQLLRYFLQQP